MLGHVTEVTDKDKFVIKFTVPNVIEDAIAYPIDTFDEPNIGDPIEVTRLEDRFGESYTYKKLRLKDHTRLKLQESLIDIFKDHIEIHAGGANAGEDAKSKILVNNDGSIVIETTKEITVKTKVINVESEDEVTIKTKTATVEAENEATIKTKTATIEASSTLELTGGGTLKTGKPGTAGANSTGAFCGIPVCPLTGAPHGSQEVKGI